MKSSKKFLAAAMSGVLLCSGAAFPIANAAVDSVTMTATIALNGDSIAVEGDNVAVEGTIVTISASGSYEISGTLNDGQIRVSVPDETVDPGTVKLYFNGASITGVSEAPLYIVNAENTSLNLVEGTENFLNDGPVYTETNAVIYAKDDITIKGDGALTITALTQHGVHCNNDLKINGGEIRVDTELEDALRGKTSVEINGGFLNINAEGDGIKSTQGDVLITGGETEVKAGNDAVQGETSLVISGGELMANGDRGLTCATAAVTISGGVVLATATDNQCASVTAEQPVMLLNFAEECVKDQKLVIYGKTAADADLQLLSMKPDKKFSFALVSIPEFTADGVYDLTLADAYLTHAAAKTDHDFTMTDALTAFDSVLVTDSKVPSILMGDVNVDGIIKIDDAVMLARYVGEDDSLVIPDGGAERMDMNKDHIVDAGDTIQILRYLAGLS